jgi:hypothetical protein
LINIVMNAADEMANTSARSFMRWQRRARREVHARSASLRADAAGATFVIDAGASSQSMVSLTHGGLTATRWASYLAYSSIGDVGFRD